jgi:hypothetical protein
MKFLPGDKVMITQDAWYPSVDEDVLLATESSSAVVVTEEEYVNFYNQDEITQRAWNLQSVLREIALGRQFPIKYLYVAPHKKTGNSQLDFVQFFYCRVGVVITMPEDFMRKIDE